MTINRRHALGLAGAFAARLAAWPARAQADWPTRPLRIMVGTAAGGSPDIISRMLADKICRAARVNRSTSRTIRSGGGSVALTTVTRAPPDGTTLTMMTAGFASGVSVGKFKYDRDESFGFVTMVCAYPMVCSVPPNSPIKSFADHAGAGQGAIPAS